MAFDALPPSIISKIKDLEDRIAILERSNKLIAATVVGGTFRVLDDEGDPIVQLGVLGSGSQGLSVSTADGATSVFYASQEEGLARPWLATPWRIPTNAQAVTSGTFADIYTSLTELLFSQEILFRVRIVVDSGTTGEMRVTISGSPLGGTQALASASDVTYEYRKAHGVSMGGGPVGIALQVRRLTGAGNIAVTTPEPLHWGSLMNVDPDGWV